MSEPLKFNEVLALAGEAVEKIAQDIKICRSEVCSPCWDRFQHWDETESWSASDRCTYALLDYLRHEKRWPTSGTYLDFQEKYQEQCLQVFDLARRLWKQREEGNDAGY